ncbi:MAG: endolytic transglycosylase MltG [Bacteroidota bacterium]
MSESYHPRFTGRKSRSKKPGRGMVITLLFLIVLAAAGSWMLYNAAYQPNIYTGDSQNAYFTIPTGSNFEGVKKSLYTHGLIINRKSFELIARLKKYERIIKPGRYKITRGMGNLELVNMLRGGRQEPVQVIFNNIRSADQLAGRISKQIEADSLSIFRLLNDTGYLDSLGVTKNSLFTIFIPNTYEFYWTTSAREFIDRMKSESEKFWNNERTEKLRLLNLNRHEVITLASIVEKETNKNDEKPRVAGVYLNRLTKGWLLEADPTLVFAHTDFDMKRVLNIHKQIVSPYNTYKYTGLPPGPICLPSVASIDAVLNREQHEYMFFCAREDFSGYHNFARGIEQHNLNAWKYQQALNRKNIFK